MDDFDNNYDIEVEADRYEVYLEFLKEVNQFES